MAEVGDLRVRLSLDNAQFERSITSMNRTLSAIGQELRTLQNRGNEWGNSLDGLRQKQETYGRLLEGQQTKVQRLAELYDKAKEEQGEFSVEAERLAVSLNRANAEMTRTETELRELNEELARQEAALRDTRTAWQRFSEASAEAGQRLEDAGKRITDVGKTLSLRITAPLAAAGAGVIKLGSEFQQQMSRVVAISGAAGDEIDELKQSALELGANTSKSASEVAIGFENLAALGFNASQIIAAMPGIIAAAEASGADLAQTADVVASSLNIFGKEAKYASDVADVLAEVANRSAADINYMQLSLKYAGPVANTLGVSLEELSAAIGIMSNAGLEGSQAGTSLRAGLLALIKPSKKSSEIMDTLGIALTDVEGNFVGLSPLIGNINESLEGLNETQKLAVLANLVGTEASSGFITLLEAGPEVIDTFTKSLENSAGSAKAAADVMKDNLLGAVEELGGSLETLALQFYDILEPVLRDIVDRVKGLVDAFAAVSPETKVVIASVAAIAAAIGPLVVTLGIFTSSLGSILKFLPLLASPIALAVVAIGLLAGAFALAYTKSEEFRNKVDIVFNKIRDIAVVVFGYISEYVLGIVNKLVEYWDQNGAQIVEAVTNVFNGVLAIIEFLMPLTLFIVKYVWDAIKNVIDGALNIILGLVSVFSGIFTGDFSLIWDGIKQIFVGAIDLILGIMSFTFLGGIRKLVVNFVKVIVGFFRGMWDDIILFFVNSSASISTGFTNLITRLVTGTGNFVLSIVNFIKNLFTNISGILTSIGNFFRTIFTTIRTTVVNLITSLVNGVINLFKSFFTGIKDIFTNIKNTIVDTISSINLVSIGANIITGLVNGIKGAASAVFDAAKDIANGVKDVFTGLFDINSPSRVTTEYGKFVGEGWEIGLDESIKGVKAAAQSLALATQTAMDPTLNGRGTNSSGSSYDYSKTLAPNVTINTIDSGAAEMERTIRRLSYGF